MSLPKFNKSLFWVSLCLGDDGAFLFSKKSGDDGAFLFSLAVTWSGSCALVDLIYISIELVGALDCWGRSFISVTIWTSIAWAGSSTLVYGSNATIELLVPKCTLPSFPDWVTGRPKLGQKKISFRIWVVWLGWMITKYLKNLYNKADTKP